MTFPRLGLRPRLAASHALLALALVGLAVVRLEEDSGLLRRDEARTGAAREAEVVALRAARLFDQRSSLAELAADEHHGGRWVELVDDQDRGVAGLLPATVRAEMRPLATTAIAGESQSRFVAGGRLVAAATPVVAGERVVGAALLVERAPGPVAFSRPLRFDFGFGALLVLVAAMAGWWLAGPLAIPLLALTQAAHRLALGNGEVRAALQSPVPEVATLGAAFDRLGDRLAHYVRMHRDRERRQRAVVRRLSHQLRTPVAVLMLRCDELLDTTLPAERRRQLAAILARQLEQLDRVARQLANFSRRPDIDAAVEPVDMAETVQHAVTRIVPLAHWSGITVVYDGPSSPATVRVERSAIEDAVANLLENAVKFSPAGSTVTVRCRRDRFEVAVEVLDQGPGIPPDERRLVLRPWARGSAVGAVPGSGLGLSLVADAASQAGGRVELEDAPGGGTLARVVLPLVREEATLEEDPLRQPGRTAAR
jgi:signal transduction histidine kinase